MRSWTQHYGHHFPFSIRMYREVKQFRTFDSTCQVVFRVARYRIHKEAFHHGCTTRSILVHDMVDRSFIAFFPNIGMDNSLTDEFLLSHFGYDEFPGIEEHNDVINFGTIVYRFRLFQAPANKPFFYVDIQFTICNNHFGCRNVIENLHFRSALFPCAKTFFQVFVIFNRIFNQVLQVFLHLFHFRFQLRDQFVCFIRIEACNTDHWDLCQAL
ncbi:hypothetical protein D3C86_1402620 [compost metagenome]